LSDNFPTASKSKKPKKPSLLHYSIYDYGKKPFFTDDYVVLFILALFFNLMEEAQLEAL
jgi:hypothetical protein